LNGTSIKAQVYDPAHNNKENFLTAYYFVDTPGYYYFDGDDGRHVKFKLDNGLADSLAPMLYGLLNDPDELADFLYEYSDFLLVDIDSGDNSIMDVLLDMAKTMGKGWDFNDAFESFCNSFNFNIQKEISRYSGLISGFLGISEDEMFDENGVLQVDSVLMSDMMNNLFLASQYEQDGRVVCQAKLNPVIITALASPSVAKILKVKNLGKLIGLNTDLILSYNLDQNGSLDGFELAFGLGDVIATVDGVQKYTQIKVCFNDMSVSNAKKGDTVKMPVARDDYKDEVTFNLDIKGTAENIKGVYNNKLYDLTGEFDTSATFRLDTVNAGAENKTQLYTFVSYNGDKFVEISLNKGKLAMTIDRSVIVKTIDDDEAPLVEVMAAMVGDNMQQFFDSLLIDVDNTKHRDDKIHREVVYRTVLSILDPSFMNAVYAAAFEKNVDGTYNFSDMKDDFVGIVFNDFDCQQLLVKTTAAYIEKNEKSDDIDVMQERKWQSKAISHVVADASSLLDDFDMENIAIAIRNVMPVLHTENDALKVQTYNFEAFIDSIVGMFIEDYSIVGKITKNNKYRDLEFFASNVAIGDNDPTPYDEQGFYDFLKSVFKTDIMAMLDFNGLATDNAVEIAIGFEDPDGKYAMTADLTMNLLEYNANDFVDLMDRADA
ncbi:MAG: hypothetical protein MJ193_02765, partial [Clostridia bacterium]|nr:hypothetical protein [Clostridia bacterium]